MQNNLSHTFVSLRKSTSVPVENLIILYFFDVLLDTLTTNSCVEDWVLAEVPGFVAPELAPPAG